MLAWWTGDCPKAVRPCILSAHHEGRDVPDDVLSAHISSALQVVMPGSQRSVEVDEVEDLSQLE